MAKGAVQTICDPDCPVLLGALPNSSIRTKPKSEACSQNWLRQQEEIASRKTVLESKPTKMKIVPTVKCTLNCELCYQDRNDTTELPDHVNRILEDRFPVLDELLIVGGEPLASRECLNIVKTMDPSKYPDLRLALITNGTSVSDDVSELLSARRIAWILVSVDAATPETYTKVRGGKFSKVIEGVNRLNEVLQRQGNMRGLQMGFVFMRSNMHEALDFLKLAESLHVGFTFQPVFGDWHGESYYHLPDEVERAKRIVDELDAYLAANGRTGHNKTERLRARIKSMSKRQLGPHYRVA